VHDGLCIDYCDKLFSVCKEEYFDPYINKNDIVPFCKSDSLLCSRTDEKASNGAEFCKLLGLPVSKLQTPTMRLDYDCFNGVSSVGVKYDRLDIDYKLINERDYPDPVEEDDDEVHPLSWDYFDEDGEDMFDNLGMMLFGGSGMVSTLFRGIIGPSLSGFRKFYRKYLRGVMQYVFMMLALSVSYELFVNRQVQNYLPCFRKGAKPRAKAPEAAKDIARQERIRMIQERLSKKAEEERS